MTTYVIHTMYPTQGHDALVWSEPEARLEEVLAERGVEIIGSDMGTVLATGDRDVWLEVHADSIGVLTEAVAMLPSSDRALWKIEESK